MSVQQSHGVANLAQLAEFDEIIDVRSPGEYAEDHLPQAINCPVLDNQQRAQVGTIYKQDSPFASKKIGAVLVARNIATHIEQQFLAKPRSWRPLVYCWRGGQRSGAFTHILRQIGWDAQRLAGGYKSWRQHVIHQLGILPLNYQYRVISGATGSGKSRVLEALGRLGEQVLHLENLAAHKGSVLGSLPSRPQPTQRMFESRLLETLKRFDPERPIFVEAESRRIGSLQLPDALLESIRAAPTFCIDAGLDARVDFLLRDYAYFLDDPGWLLERFELLRSLQSNETLLRWRKLVETQNFRTLVEELLALHYDPLYQRSQAKNFRGYEEAVRINSHDLTPDGVLQLAQTIKKLIG